MLIRRLREWRRYLPVDPLWWVGPHQCQKLLDRWSALVCLEALMGTDGRGEGECTPFLGQEDGAIVLALPSREELPKLVKELSMCQWLIAWGAVGADGNRPHHERDVSWAW